MSSFKCKNLGIQLFPQMIKQLELTIDGKTLKLYLKNDPYLALFLKTKNADIDETQLSNHISY